MNGKQATGPQPRVQGVKETCLYVADLAAARDFYQTVFGFPVLAEDPRFCAFDVAGRDVLILFQQGETAAAVELPGGIIPPHDGAGPVHLGLAIANEQYERWRQRLAEQDVPVESTVEWPRGGRSLYFRDPDGHLLELLTPGVWPTY